MDWIGIAPADCLALLEPLRAAHARSGSATLLAGGRERLAELTAHALGCPAAEVGGACTASGWVNSAGPAAPPRCVLLVEPPGSDLPDVDGMGPWWRCVDGRDALLGRLCVTADPLHAYVTRALALIARSPPAAGDAGERSGAPVPRLPLVLLAPRETRYLDGLSACEATLAGQPAVLALRWSAERIRRAPLRAALRIGAGAVIYHGHGDSRGWHAYGGVQARDLIEEGNWSTAQACSVLFSLACGTAGEARDPGAAATEASARAADVCSAGFAASLIRQGVAGAVLAPTGAVLHADNRRLLGALVQALADGARHLPGLLACVRAAGCRLDGYCITGDPALPLAGSPGAVQRGLRVSAPAADAVLTPLLPAER